MSNLNNKIKNLSFNPRELSREQLLLFLKLPENASQDDIINKVKYLLEDQTDPSIQNFLYLVLTLLTEKSENMSNQVFSQEYLGNNPENSTVLGPNITQIQTDNPSQFNYNVQVEQGTKNPRYIEKYTSYLIINSALRPNPITTPSETFSIDVDFNEVLSLRLSSIYITPSWYNFDHTFSNTSFYLQLQEPIKVYYKKTNFSLDAARSPDLITGPFCVCITPAYYDSTTLLQTINNANLKYQNEFIYNGNIDYPWKVKDIISFTLDTLPTNKIKINLNDNSYGNISIIFYDPTLTYCDASGCPNKPLPKLNYNLGYYLGFRGATQGIFPPGANPEDFEFGQKGLSIPDLENNKFIIKLNSFNDPIISFSQLNLNTSINAILSVDDYNKNVFPNKINLITPRSNQLSLPNYYNKGIPCDVSGNLPDTRQTSLSTQNPRKFSLAQLYTIQEILNQNSNSYYLEPFGGGGGSSNELATFNLECNKIFNKRFSREDNTQRLYTGAVRIGRLKINLTTSNGIPLNLHRNDWELVLELEQHYQSLN